MELLISSVGGSRIVVPPMKCMISPVGSPISQMALNLAPYRVHPQHLLLKRRALGPITLVA